jgi:hypothetical protein
MNIGHQEITKSRLFVQPNRLVLGVFVLMVGVCNISNVIAEQTFTVAKPIVFKQGSAKQKATLSKIEDARDVLEGKYLVAAADLNDDGRVEVILQSNDSMYCGSGGCLTVVIEQPIATNTKTYTLLSQNLGNGLAVTNEKVGNYRALASLMEDGSIQVADKKRNTASRQADGVCHE